MWLAFSGGEIFLRSDLVEITRIFYKNNRPAIILLPTKGLTLPFVSYGGTSLIVCCAMVALVLRIDRDTRTRGRRR